MSSALVPIQFGGSRPRPPAKFLWSAHEQYVADIELSEARIDAAQSDLI